MSLAEVNLAFLCVSIILYCLLAGADFGAGILEFFTGKKLQTEQRELITHAIAPVWEANHVWLVLGLVILFNGFPKAYSFISTDFHIPLTLLLIGIVLRGCAFTFRHYDAVKDNSQRYYTAVFVISSFLSPLFLGIIAGGIILGKAPIEVQDFHSTFIAPWLNSFCLSMGFFTCSLFTFLASVYLIGETTDPILQSIFVKRAFWSNFFAVVSGALVLISAASLKHPLAQRFLHEPMALSCMVLATLLLFPLWRSIRRSQIIPSRIYAAAQVVLVLLGWFRLQYPSLASAASGESQVDLTIFNTAAPEATQIQLLYALIAGCALIFPALFFLFRIFKRKEHK